MANDNLSGIALVTAVGEWLAQRPRRRTYRLLFAPGTLGAITWLARNEPATERIVAGLVVSGVGDLGGLTFKSSRRGDSLIDRAVPIAMRDLGEPVEVLPFTPYGYDERQFCSPGFNLPVGRLSRTPHGTYPEYHTSADDLDFISAPQLGRAFTAAAAITATLDADRTWRNVSPKGEPQLGRRGLYRSVGALPMQPDGLDYALLWVLNLADGRHSLIDMAQRSEMPFPTLVTAAELLAGAGLLAPA
jgi:aminopeptidase-like protein